MTKGLTPREKLFCAEYVRNGSNGQKAAIFAGYSAKSARFQGSKLATRGNIKAYIQTIEDKVETKMVNKIAVTKDYVRSRLVEITERCMQATPLMEYNHEEKRMEQVMAQDADGKTVGVFQFNANAARGCLELLGKELKMWKEVVSVETNDLAAELDEGRKRLANAKKKQNNN